MILRSSYRKLARMGLETSSTEFRSDALFCSAYLSYQVMSSTRTQSQLCAATSTSSVHELPQSHCGDNREGTSFS